MGPPNSSYLSNTAIFHWTMIMGERVLGIFCKILETQPLPAMAKTKMKPKKTRRISQ